MTNAAEQLQARTRIPRSECGYRAGQILAEWRWCCCRAADLTKHREYATRERLLQDGRALFWGRLSRRWGVTRVLVKKQHLLCGILNRVQSQEMDVISRDMGRAQ